MALAEPGPETATWTAWQEVATEPLSRKLVAANWKMHLLRADAEAFCSGLLDRLPADAPQVAIFPSFPLIPVVADQLAGSDVVVGGQDLHPEEKGAHTGDVSGVQLVDAGASWVLCGHSERRRDHGERDELVGGKLRAAIRAGLTPLLCVGETREERAEGLTYTVLARQLQGALGPPSPGQAPSMPRFALAYEPVWAIGTGEVATPETASEAHLFLRQELVRRLGEEAAEAISIVYGGSVTPENAPDLAAAEGVDGFLVGGASLDLDRFLSIISPFGRTA
ncbi:MAG TPA: triose-phosphate isomerase [Thermoanaerobaculia bacterium]|jgi:triosephosphate isomerase|nr:triose-phosphate isomerase [Thermoanaerobaculia bacterium]